MERYYEAQFKELLDLLLRLSYLSIENYSRALQGIFSRDPELCEQVVEADEQIDEMEVRIDQACIDILLMRQPVAKDLRFVTMSMKINTNLERMGDQAVYIARLGCDLSDLPPLKNFFGLPMLGEKAKTAVRTAIDSLVDEDTELARSIAARDPEINRLHRDIIRRILHYMAEEPSKITQAVDLIFLAKAMERVADYGKNIAYEVVYMVDAVDDRHRSTG
ncbi:MAG: phosphate signaling complex protein PhoU [Candidatus Eisenbacteria bacterium]|nr:phosphate signaling complex protein PhoU [Candidatus Latescibacterota bacterium]MBD3302630.1 phosphate signaling complex protein PhoU [Candidatus Eisenbacteria bacterium]